MLAGTRARRGGRCWPLALGVLGACCAGALAAAHVVPGGTLRLRGAGGAGVAGAGVLDPVGPDEAQQTAIPVRAPLRTADPAAPRITRQDVLNCQIEEWYPAFSRHSIKTKFIELSPEFVEYLLADGLILPVGCEPPSAAAADNDGDDDSWGDFTGAGAPLFGGAGSVRVRAAAPFHASSARMRPAGCRQTRLC